MSKENKISYASCYVHGGDKVDTRLLHEHHKVPQGYGGSDTPDNRVWLCGGCHDHTHRIAQYLLSGKEGLASDLSRQAFPGSPAARQRLHELAKVAAKAQQEYIPKEGATEEEDDVVIVQLYMPRSLHSKLKTLAGSHVNKKSKRRVGLYNYILTVLRNHVRVANVMTARNADPQVLYAAKPETDPDVPPPSTNEPILRDLP